MKTKRQSGGKKLTVLNILLVIALLGSVAFVIYSKTRNNTEPIKELPKEESASQAVTTERSEKVEISEAEKAKKAELVGKYSEEVTFDKPIDVTWEGKIIAIFHSGTDYGIEINPKDKDYPFFYAYTGDKANVATEGNLRITGKWTGITCAYQNTIFGRCVPDVEVEKIERLPDEFSFSDFPSSFSLYKGDIAGLNFGSDPKVSLFKTRLEEGIAKGGNFDGHFNITTWGCGTNCQQLAVINVTNGDVYFPFDNMGDYKQESGSLVGAEDISYTADSNLLVIHPMPMHEGMEKSERNGGWISGTKYYLWEYSRFVEAKEDGVGMLLYNKIEETKKLPFTSFWEEKPVEIKEAVGKPFELPPGYDIAISKNYKGKGGNNYKVLALSRFVYNEKYNPDNFVNEETGTRNFDDFLENCGFSNPSLLAILDDNNIIRYFSTLPASCLFPETVQGLDLQSEREKSLEFLDMNNDGIDEILVETYMPAVTDWLYKLNVFSFNPEKNEFSLATADKAFNSNYKNSYRVISRKGRFFIAQADAGSAECHMCDSVYTINVYDFNFYPNSESKKGYFFEVATVVSEKELETGSEAMKYKMNEIYEKIDTLLSQ